jgi:hypothetical protein
MIVFGTNSAKNSISKNKIFCQKFPVFWEKKFLSNFEDIFRENFAKLSQVF